MAVEAERKARKAANLEEMIKYKATCEAEIAYCKAHGLPAPDPIPHPDQVILDFQANTACIIGSMTRQERDELDKWIIMRDDLLEDRAALVTDLAEASDAADRQALQSDLARTDRTLQMFDDAIKGCGRE